MITVATISLSLIGLSAVFLVPVAIMQAFAGHWMGVEAYLRASAWGAVFLFVADVAIREAFS